MLVQGQPRLDAMNVLISLYKGYGMGDAVKMSAVLKHVRKYRPYWNIVFRAQDGQEQVGSGIAHQTCCYDQALPDLYYHHEVQITLYDQWRGYTDRPNTQVSLCLKDHFDLDWDHECGRYEINPRSDAKEAALGVLRACDRSYDGEDWVAVHYQGDSARCNKNLTHLQALSVCRAVEKAGARPILLDWRDESPLPDTARIPTVGRFGFSRAFGRSPEMNAAIIARCRAFIGVDSGPAKCASATDIPSLIVWTKHHPARFHDPAPNTVHLVPEGFHNMLPLSGLTNGVIEWFEKWYNVGTYVGCPVGQIIQWINDVLC